MARGSTRSAPRSRRGILLLAAAEQVGVERVVAQGLAYAYDPSGSGLADEDTPLWRQPPAPFVPVLAALKGA